MTGFRPAAAAMCAARDRLRPATAAVLIAVLCGCATQAGPRPTAMAAAVERETGCASTVVDRIAVGGLKLAAARALSRVAAVDTEAEALLRYLKRVEIVELTTSSDSACGWIESADGFVDELTASGWRQVFRERGDRTADWVLSRPAHNGTVTGLYAIDVDVGHLEIIMVEGRIDQMLAEATSIEVRSMAREVAGGG